MTRPPSRSTHVTGLLIGAGFLAVGAQRAAGDSLTLGLLCLAVGVAFIGWHLRRLVALRRSEQSR